MRVYYFTCAQWALDDIQNKWLKVCRFSALNDPFELFAGDMQDGSRRKQMKEWATDIDRRRGLLCFTTVWHDPLMWSHYGDRHRGMCLGFDVERKILKNINYVPNRLLLAPHPEADVLPTVEFENLLLTTKFKPWIYEKERRVIVSLTEAARQGDHYFRRFDEGLKLVQVIAGPRCITKKNEITAALGDRASATEVVKSRLAFKTFRVVRNNMGFKE